MEEDFNKKDSCEPGKRRALRSGFSTGTGVTAAARAALRLLLTGTAPQFIAVRLAAGYFLPVPIHDIRLEGEGTRAIVVKDGGDDPDVTNGAQLHALVRIFRSEGQPAASGQGDSSPWPELHLSPGICLVGGEGVGVATKPGLPVKVGEPAINPGPREMLSRNLTEEILLWTKHSSTEESGQYGHTVIPCPLTPALSPEAVERENSGMTLFPEAREREITEAASCSEAGEREDSGTTPFPKAGEREGSAPLFALSCTKKDTASGRMKDSTLGRVSETLKIPGLPHVFVPFSVEGDGVPCFLLLVEIQAPRGEAIARRTLNPRLGIMGGISILGTTGIVKPFSHKAYEETIDVALSVAESNGCKEIVLSTGGKSEHFAKSMLPHLRIEAFVQIADFFAYAVGKARDMGFRSIIHSAFLGKVVKMAQGHAYTHAHEVPLDLGPLARTAGTMGYDDAFCAMLAASNTARHALEFLLASSATDVVQAAARQALEKSAHIAEHKPAVRLLLFDYDGKLLADQKTDP